MKQRIFATVALLLPLAVGQPTTAQSPAPPNLHIEGDWVRIDPNGVGSFDGLSSVIPPAQLLPGVSAGGRGGRRRGAPAGDSGPHAAGDPYIVVQQPCNGAAGGGRGNGALLLNPDSGGIHIIEQKDEVILAGERGGVRHIYLDAESHPNAKVSTPTWAGHSVGHYEGRTLVVETTGFTSASVPGGGRRDAGTRLAERFDVSPDGKRLVVTYTWSDPAIYRTPHEYRYFFDRLPPGSYALEEWCDAGDPLEKQSIVPPEQIPPR